MDRRNALLLIAGAAALPLRPGFAADRAAPDDAVATQVPAGPPPPDTPSAEEALRLVLRPGEESVVIRHVCLNSANGLVRLDTAAGLRRRSEAAIDPDTRPYFGAFRHAPYGAEDFGSGARIGRAYADGVTMFVYLMGAFTLTTGLVRLVVLNGRYSYLFADAYHPVSRDGVAERMPNFLGIGTVQRVLEAGLLGAAPAAELDRMVLGGEVTQRLPFMRRGPAVADLPRLAHHAVGDVYRREKEGPEITVLVRPSIVLDPM